MGPWASGLRKLVAQAQDECGLDFGLQAHDEGAHGTVMDKDECSLARTHCSAR